jgi:hypothetical protein
LVPVLTVSSISFKKPTSLYPLLNNPSCSDNTAVQLIEVSFTSEHSISRVPTAGDYYSKHGNYQEKLLIVTESSKAAHSNKNRCHKVKFPKDGRGLKVCRHPAPHVSRGHPEMELVDPAVAPVPPHNSPDKTQLQTPACSSLSKML